MKDLEEIQFQLIFILAMELGIAPQRLEELVIQLCSYNVDHCNSPELREGLLEILHHSKYFIEEN